MIRTKNYIFFDELSNNEAGISDNNRELANAPQFSYTDGIQKNTISLFYDELMMRQDGISKNNKIIANGPQFINVKKIIPYTVYVEYNGKNLALEDGSLNH